MALEEGSIHGVIRKAFLRKALIPSSLNSPAMEDQEGEGRKRSEDMLNIFTLS
jgi:hypothetical protein